MPYTGVRTVWRLSRDCREWPEGATNEAYSRPGIVVVFTNGSVRTGVKSGGAYSARQNGVVVAKGSGAFAQTASIMGLEVRAISEAIVWLEGYVLPYFSPGYAGRSCRPWQ